MKRLAVLAALTAAIGASLAGAGLAQAGGVDCSSTQAITVNGGIAFGSQASLNITVAQGCRGVVLGAASYVLPNGAGFPANTPQGDYAHQSFTLDAGTYTLSVDYPVCRTQVDFYIGAFIPGDQLSSTNGYGRQGRLIKSANHGTNGCGSISAFKVLNPTDDPGRFDLSVDGHVVRAAAGNNQGGTLANLDAGDYLVSEAAAAGTNMADYTSTYDCDNGQSGTGTQVMVHLTIADIHAACEFVNTRKQAPPTVVTVTGSTSVTGMQTLTQACPAPNQSITESGTATVVLTSPTLTGTGATEEAAQADLARQLSDWRGQHQAEANQQALALAQQHLASALQECPVPPVTPPSTPGTPNTPPPAPPCQPDLSASKTADSASVSTGTSASFTVTLKNSSASCMATNVVLHEYPGAGLGITGVSINGANCIIPGTMLCSVGTIPPGGSVMVKVTTPALPPGTYTNCAAVSSNVTAETPKSCATVTFSTPVTPTPPPPAPKPVPKPPVTHHHKPVEHHKKQHHAKTPPGGEFTP